MAVPTAGNAPNPPPEGPRRRKKRKTRAPARIAAHCPLHGNANANRESVWTTIFNESRHVLGSHMDAAFVPMVKLPSTLITMGFFRSGHPSMGKPEPFWFPNHWFLYTLFMVSSSTLGFASWMIYTLKGLQKLRIAVLPYLAYLACSSCWVPVMFVERAYRCGFLLSIAMLVCAVNCEKAFKGLNRAAGELANFCVTFSIYIIMLSFMMAFWPQIPEVVRP